MNNNQMQCSQPLITVVVITYNSSQYVLETLDSVKNQTYNNIEIIISDDCSTDNTLEICNEWLQKNKTRFISSKIIKTDYNSGISHNYNNGLKHAAGEWVKYIAGDDKLKPECIEKLVARTTLNKDRFIISKQLNFSSSNPYIEILPIDLSPYFKDFKSKLKRVRFQELYLLRVGTKIPGPTLFLHTQTLRNIGGFDEKYPFIEDFPLAMKYLKNGYPIGCVDKILIEYRVYPASVSHSNQKFADSIYAAIDDYCIPAAKKLKKPVLWYHYWSSKKLRNNSYPKLFRYLLRSLDFFYLKKKYLNSTKFI